MKTTLELVIFGDPESNLSLFYTQRISITFSKLNVDQELQKITMTW